MPSSDVDPAAFRDAIGLLPTGVTVVTAFGENGASGATANAVCSLSLSPMLMLACLDRDSRTLRSAQAAGRFAVNVLGASQEWLARQFSTKLPEPDKWAGVEWTERAGTPAIGEALLWIACELHDVLMGGDHVILTGAVAGLKRGDGEPLLFHRGRYTPLNASGA